MKNSFVINPLLVVAATGMELSAALASVVSIPPNLAVGVPHPLRRCNLVVLATGVGPVNAAFALGRTLATSEVAGVLHVGIAGTFEPEHYPLGTAVLARAEVYPDYGVMISGRMDHRGIGLAQARDEDGSVWERLELRPQETGAIMGLNGAALDDYPRAVFLTSGTVTGDMGRARILKKRYGAALENMEGFALALGCLRAEVPFVELRTVSNPVGERSKELWDFKLAMKSLGKACTSLLSPAFV